jgi:ParB/RepB/Spo0J family partition protein
MSLRPIDLPLEKLRLPSHYVREGVDDNHVDYLMGDVERRGLLEPLLVKPLTEGFYEIMDGVHRYHALRKLGWKDVPCLVREASNQEAVTLQVITNYRKRRLKDFELVRAVSIMHDELGMRLDAIAKELDYSKGYVSKLHRIYQDKSLYEDLKKGIVTLREAYERVRGKSFPGKLEQQGYPARCAICGRQHPYETCMRFAICPQHSLPFSKILQIARLVLRSEGDEGLKRLTEKAAKDADSVL